MPLAHRQGRIQCSDVNPKGIPPATYRDHGEVQGIRITVPAGRGKSVDRTTIMKFTIAEGRGFLTAGFADFTDRFIRAHRCDPWLYFRAH